MKHENQVFLRETQAIVTKARDMGEIWPELRKQHVADLQSKRKQLVQQRFELETEMSDWFEKHEQPLSKSRNPSRVGLDKKT